MPYFERKPVEGLLDPVLSPGLPSRVRALAEPIAAGSGEDGSFELRWSGGRLGGDRDGDRVGGRDAATATGPGAGLSGIGQTGLRGGTVHSAASRWTGALRRRQAQRARRSGPLRASPLARS